jgi:hypothetical protein
MLFKYGTGRYWQSSARAASGNKARRPPSAQAVERKGQACESKVGAKVGLLHRFIVGMFGLEV